MTAGPLDPAVAKARRLVRDALTDIEAGDAVVVAVSGGADSLALAAAVSFVAPREGWTAEAVVVDHGLQPGSDEVAERAAAQCRELDLDVTVVRVDVGSGGGPEAAARRARYAALDAHAELTGAVAILTAHTLDDQAESVLLGLGRGSGARSLAGMPTTRGLIRRPFLGLRHSEAQAICRAYGLEPWADPHNTDPAYRRVRVRHELLPLMDEILGGGVPEALARTADQLARDADHLDATAAAWWHASGGRIDVLEIEKLHPAIRSRVLRLAALDAGAAGGELTAGHIGVVDSLITDWHGQICIELPGRIIARRVGDHLIFEPRPVTD